VDQNLFEVMRSLLTEDRHLFSRSQRGWLLPSCVICVGLIKQLHDVAEPETALATNLTEKGSTFLCVIDQYLLTEFDHAQSYGIFVSKWLHPSPFYFHAQVLLAECSGGDVAPQSWRLAQLGTIFSMSCRLTRLFGLGHLAWVYDDTLPSQTPSPHVQREQFRQWAAQTVMLATILVRSQSPPQAKLLWGLLRSIDSHRAAVKEVVWLAAFRKPLQDFFVLFFGSEVPIDFEVNLEYEAAVPKSLYQYMSRHWDYVGAPPLMDPAAVFYLSTNPSEMGLDPLTAGPPNAEISATHPPGENHPVAGPFATEHRDMSSSAMGFDAVCSPA
jgi:hypothetical protein